MSLTLSRIFSLCLAFCILAIPNYAAAKSVLRFATDRNSKSEIAAVEKIIANFTAKNPEVEIKIEPVAWKDQRTFLITSIASGTVPDIYNSAYPQLLHHAKLGNILPVDDLIDEIGHSDFFEGYLEQGAFRGHYWGVPWTGEGTCFWYRKDLFDEKGLKVPKTWEELLECAKALTMDTDGDGRKDIYGIVVPYGKGNMTHKYFHAFLRSNDGAMFDKNLKPSLNSPQALETLEFLKELAKYSPPGSAEFGFAETLMTFVLGKSAMTYYFGRTLSKVAASNPGIIDKIGAFRIKRKNYVSHIIVENLVVPKGAKYPEIAKKFIKYFLTDPSYLDIMHSVPGHFYPSLKSIANSDAYQSHPLFKDHPDIFKVLKSSHTVGSAPHYEYPHVPNPNMDNVVNAAVTQDVLQRMLIKGESPREALEWGQKKMEGIMEEVKKTEQ